MGAGKGQQQAWVASSCVPVSQAVRPEDQLEKWGKSVCAVVKVAGKRISKSAFETMAWFHFGSGSNVTVDSIAAAWTSARVATGWPGSGTIPQALRIDEAALRQLLVAKGLLHEQEKGSGA
jgi:hypothetical protein